MTNRYRSLNNWHSLITECRRSVTTDAQWCRVNKVSRDAFTLQSKRLRKKAIEIPISFRSSSSPNFTNTSSQDVVNDICTDLNNPKSLTDHTSDETLSIRIQLGAPQASTTNKADIGCFEFIIRQAVKILEDQCTDENIYGSIGSGIRLFTVKRCKDMFIYPGKYLFVKDFGPGLFQKLTFSLREKREHIKKGELW